MSPLYVYGITDAPAERRETRSRERQDLTSRIGIMGEPLQIITGRGVAAIVGYVTVRPSLSVEALRSQHRLVTALARQSDALLPARFGSLVATRTELRHYLRASNRILRDALDVVRGAVQMTIRVAGKPERGATAAREQPTDARRPVRSSLPRRRATTGTEYLRRRAQVQHRQHSLPEIQPLLDAVAPLVRAERIERADTAERIGTVYHLVPNPHSARYSSMVLKEARRLRNYRITIAGPDAAYAFTPERGA